MKRSKGIANLICLCLMSGSFAVAQQSKPEQKPEAKPTAAATGNTAADQTKTRTRRAAEKTKPAADPNSEAKTEEGAKPSEEQPKETEPAVADQPETPTEKAEPAATEKAQSPAPAKESAAPDEIAELRDQIEAAGTPAEKTQLQLQLAEKLVAKGAKQEAIDELRRATAAEKFDPPGFYNIGNALARLGDSEGAVSAYKKAIEQKKGRYSRALNNLGVIQLRQGLWDQAYESLLAALRLENFRYAEASYNMGRLYAARGESDLAIREWRRAVSVNPDHTAAKQALAGSGNFNRVAVAPTSAPRKTVESQPAPVSTPTSVASAKPSKPRAVTHTVDRETFGYLQTARTSIERNRQDEALANYQRVISRMNGYFAPANLEMGYLLINLKRDDEAIAALVPVTEKDGARYPISYYHLARLYEARGELKVAEDYFTRAASFYKQDNAQFLLDVSRVREKLGDTPGALSALEEYVTLMNKKNLKPDWSDARLAALRDKLSASPTKP
jgi:tetratricopeptide (TPR) repeat protein